MEEGERRPERLRHPLAGVRQREGLPDREQAPVDREPHGCYGMHNIRESPRHDDSPGPQRPIQVEGGADQSQVRERLREIAQGLSAWAGLLGVQAEVVGIPFARRAAGRLRVKSDLCGRRG